MTTPGTEQPADERVVWVVDDNAAVAQSITLMLQTEHLPAIGLTSGQVVLDRLAKGESPSILLIDLTMPGVCGNKVIGAIMNEPQHTFPIIVLTGWEEHIDKAVQPRVHKILPKTIAPLDLVMYIRRAIGERISWRPT